MLLPRTAEDAFASGTPFRTVRGQRTGHVGAVLGAGGQGAVFDAELDGQRFALKWYHPSYAAVDTRLRSRLLRAVERGPPHASFLWPIDLATVRGKESFGYLMPLRDGSFVGMKALIARPPERIEPPLAVRAAICLHVAEGFLQLHGSGFCYQDVNFGNVFFHPGTGAVLICDNDNVDVDGSPPTVFGTRKFMAPEVVRRNAMPSTDTDLFSMAVLFFYVLHGWHPLDGKREAAIRVLDTAAELSLYGDDPVFLFDPGDGSNGPATMHAPVAARWRALSAAVRGLFLRSFTEGLRSPRARVREAEWMSAFAALALRRFACHVCGFEHALEDAREPARCTACGGGMQHPPSLRVGRSLVALLPGCNVPEFVLRPDAPLRLGTAGATVEAHPQRPGVLGLRNRTGVAWRVRFREGSEVAVPPAGAVRLLDGARIAFGDATGTVSAPEGEPA